MVKRSRKPLSDIIRAAKRKSVWPLVIAVISAVIYYAEPTEQSTPPTEPQHTETKGNATVHDGDTIKINGQTIRLEAIDAPELRQTCNSPSGKWGCGIVARDELRAFLSGKVVNCEKAGVDKYRRVLGYCSIDSIDINQWMVANGYAIAYRHFSEKYVPDEERAKAAKLGIWQGKFIEPYQWRKRNKN